MHAAGATSLQFNIPDNRSLGLMTPISHDSQKKAILPDDSLGEPLDSLGIELGRISAEIQSINSGFQAHMQQVLAETRAAFEKHYEARLDRCIDDLRERMRLEIRVELERELQEKAAKRTAQIAAVNAEIENNFFIGRDPVGMHSDCRKSCINDKMHLRRISRVPVRIVECCDRNATLCLIPRFLGRTR